MQDTQATEPRVLNFGAVIAFNYHGAGAICLDFKRWASEVYIIAPGLSLFNLV